MVKSKNHDAVISIRLDADRLRHLRKLSHQMSLEGEEIRYTDLIRRAVEKEYGNHEEQLVKQVIQ